MSPESQHLRERAETLRTCARRARVLAGSLDGYLDGVTSLATHEGVWSGPFATDSTATLSGDRKTLRGLAADLRVDAGRWLAAAGHLDDQAGDIEKQEKRQKQKSGPH